MILKPYTTPDGIELLYKGEPNFNILNDLANGMGDMWHSSFEQGFKNAFPDILYQTAVFFWYGHDFNNLGSCVSWRLNPNSFVIRKSVWESLDGFDNDYDNTYMAALDFAYNALRNNGAIPLYVNGLFLNDNKEPIVITAIDRYLFYRKNFKKNQAKYMLWRKGFWKYKELKTFNSVFKHYKKRENKRLIPPRDLNAIEGNPTVSYIIPTMLRQDYTLRLLEDLRKQSYPVSQVIVVDATPVDKRDESLYKGGEYPFEVIFKWQTTKGSCRARNEAINLCNGDYIVFGDDDIRIPSNFIENHIRLLQTYGAGACNGLDIEADHENQTLEDLSVKLKTMDAVRWKVGVSQSFSNANSCVKREYIEVLKGNDVNYDGGYGEDSDFGISLSKIGVVVLHNPFSANLHLKPPQGGYRFWGTQAKIIGKKRKVQPWELDVPVKTITPRPSPTIMYQLYKQFSEAQRKEYRYKYFIRYLFKGPKMYFPLRLIKLPYRILQYKKSVFYAKNLMKLGVRTE
ncbi:glycosyltransferase family 2 protein [Flavivirga aquimarina]|uniref:Glycosyltransferase family 2 protein n=1 Tax=Flavivirga aquimarina TaxID=2027862 RepID=A0ABT8WBM6_9FLAO|nr:glycosyltransferase family 2 protein [Flavivirga aquimarina]MDO5970551.1 glycosyltransferase family 2 protein [Flavivirga aquimarina]